LHVRLAKEGEGCKSLDGVDRVLSAGDVVVADERGPQCVGGIIGGESSAISDSTKRIILEAANWDPVVVRQTAKRQGVRTDASNRFEKNQSPYLCPVGVQRFIELLKRCDSQIEVGGALVDTFPIVPSEVKVPVDGDYIRTRLGHPISNGEIGQILTNLGFVFDSSKREVSVPYYRATRDISIAEDLIEEVGRILGYAEIPEAAPKFPATVTPFEKIRSFENSIQDLLRGVGFSAVYAYSIVGSRRMQELGYDVSRAVYLENPLDVDEDSLRVSLVPGMIRLIEENARHENQVALFELGRSYELWRDPGTNRETPPAHERRLLCLGYMSGLDEQNYSQISQPATTAGGDFYAVAASVARIVRLVTGARFEILPNTGAGTGASSDDPFALRTWMHPHRQGRIVVDGKSIGVIAEVHPAMTDAKSRSVLVEIDLGELLALEGVRDYREVSRYPDSFFELSIVMPERKPYRELEQFLRSHIEQSNLRRLDVVAHYRGAPLKEDEKSVSVKFFLGRDDRTLAREELQSIQESLIAAVRKGGFRLSGEAAA
ncbi:MAG: hypothetical protein IT290_12585, partial [Deltaproteobacteria bacterium]|nr:hypothetical protein [Deltaproteobacteria bacterium]